MFYALWPRPALRQALAAATADAVARVAGNRVPPGNLHVTLVFLGSVPGRALADLIVVGGKGRWPGVRLDFDGIEYWHKPRVLVAVPQAVPEPGIEIVDRLWRALEPHGFHRDARPWRPHLTLVRKVAPPPARDLDLAMAPRPARDAGAWNLALVESVTHPEGPRYKPLADWPLA